jgi:RNA polymerase sigma factor (TIGR02999 family)
MEPVERTVTRLLQAAKNGDESATEELVPLVYQELHRLAKGALGPRANATLQPTALVHEAYMKLVGASSTFEDRRHFFCAAARAMRDVLIDEARRKGAQKRGGGWRRVDVEGLSLTTQAPPADLLALEDALEELEAEEPELMHLVELRFFAGLTEEETADVLGVSTRTVQRQWRFARAWLWRELGGGPA